MTTEEINIIFFSGKLQENVRIEIPTGDKKGFTFWRNSCGYQFDTIKECIDFMEKDCNDRCILIKIQINHNITFEV